MKRMICIALFVLICVSFVGCAEIQQSVIKSKSSYESIWKACINSVSDVGFSVSSTDMAGGLIIADQSVFGGHGTVSRLNILLTKSADGVSVSVKFIPPPGTMGGGSIVDDYIKALKGHIPDIEVSNTQ